MRDYRVMGLTEYREALVESVAAAKAAGELLRAGMYGAKRINTQSQHDIKLELDVRSRELIERRLRRRFAGVAVLGEEGDRRLAGADARWVIDPIDGTVNYAFGIPHACVSIALQVRNGREFETVVGVVHDPFVNECWTAVRAGVARLNGRPIRVSERRRWYASISS